MIHREGQYENKPYILERFESIDEFIKTIESRPITKAYKDHPSVLDARSEEIRRTAFRGVKSYSEAREQFINGTKAKATMLKAYQTEVDPRQRQAVNAPCGCAPIVAHALMGVPDAMIDIRRKRIPKAVKVIIDMGVNCGVEAHDIVEAGKQIIAAVGKLESQGISTEITCTSDGFLDDRQYNAMGVTIKNAGQGFSAARVSFPMSSPAFLRVFNFIYTGTLPGARYDFGLGRPVADMKYGKDLDTYYRTMYGDGIYISLAKVIRTGKFEIDNAINKWRNGR